MDEQTFQAKFSELIDRIRQLPDEARSRIEKATDDALDRRDRIQKAVGELQESLDCLRMLLKYLVFDLEATRRENAYLRRLIEDINRDRNHADRRDNDDDDDENDEE